MTRNIKLNYLYRDAANYKLFGSVVFSNPDNISITDIENKVRKHLIDGEYFEPRKWIIPVLAFPEYDTVLDHDWNEYLNTELTGEMATDKRTISEFLYQII